MRKGSTITLNMVTVIVVVPNVDWPRCQGRESFPDRGLGVPTRRCTNDDGNNRLDEQLQCRPP